MVTGMLSVVMPAYNESDCIANNLRETAETLSSFGYDYEILLVDDGSPDKTYMHAAQVLKEYPHHIRVVHYDENQGKGNALVCGASLARGEYIAFLDADMDLHPSQLPTFFGIMEATNADIIVGSKLHPASNVNYPSRRRIYSFGYYLLVRILFGLPTRDTQTGINLFRAKVLHQILPKLLVKRFAFAVELLAIAHRLGYRMADAPVTLNFRRKFGRVTIWDIVCILCDTLAIFYRMKVLHYYDSETPTLRLVDDETQVVRQISADDLDQYKRVV